LGDNLTYQFRSKLAWDFFSLSVRQLARQRRTFAISTAIAPVSVELSGAASEIGDDARVPDLVLAGQAGDGGTGFADPAALNDRNALPIRPYAKQAACRPFRCRGSENRDVLVGA
jgi:hypothetical protein